MRRSHGLRAGVRACGAATSRPRARARVVARCCRLNALVTRMFNFKPSQLKWVRLCKMLLGLVVLAHLLGCVFWIFGCDSEGLPSPDGWIYAQELQDEKSVVKRCAPGGRWVAVPMRVEPAICQRAREGSRG